MIDVIRKETSKSDIEKEAFDQLVKETDVLQTIRWVFEMNDAN